MRQVDANEFLRELESHADFDAEDKIDIARKASGQKEARYQVKYGSPGTQRAQQKKKAEEQAARKSAK